MTVDPSARSLTLPSGALPTDGSYVALVIGVSRAPAAFFLLYSSDLRFEKHGKSEVVLVLGRRDSELSDAVHIRYNETLLRDDGPSDQLVN